MAKNRRPATLGQEREAAIKMAADESKLSRRTGNYKEQSTAGASARAKKYIEPVVDTTLNVTSLGGSVIGAAKMIPLIVKGALKLFTPKNAAKVLKEGTGKIAPKATTAQKKAVDAANKRMEQAGYNKTDAAKARDAAKDSGKPSGQSTKNIYEESKRTVDPIPPTSGAGRPRSPGGVQTKAKPTGKSTGKKVDDTISPGAAAAAGAVALSPFLVPGKKGNGVNTAPKKGESGSRKKPIDVATLKVTSSPSNPPAAESTSPAPAKFDSEPDPRKNPSAWRKWNFKRVKAAKKAGVKPESIAKSSMDKEISERNTYEVSDKRGGRIKTSPKVKRAASGMVKPKKKTSSPRGAGCAQRGYGKAMMGGGKVKAYKAGGKVGGNRLY